MKLATILPFICLLVGCAVPVQRSTSQVRDGIYRLSGDGNGYFVWIVSPSGQPTAAHVNEFRNYLPYRIEAFAVQPQGTNWFVQIQGTTSTTNWSEEPILVVARGKPYCKVTKSGSATSEHTTRVRLPAIITFEVRSAIEANSVVDALRNRFSVD
jgi:hypothetical protein